MLIMQQLPKMALHKAILFAEISLKHKFANAGIFAHCLDHCMQYF